MEPITPALARPDDERPSRRLWRRKDRPGLPSTLIVFFFPHFWVGIGLALAVALLAARPLLETEVPGVVVDKTESRDGDGVSAYRVVVAYDDDGAGVERRAVDIERALYASLERGSDVTLRVVDLYGRVLVWLEQEPVPWFIVAFAVFWNAMLAVFFWKMSGRTWLDWWLARHGQATPGEILDVTVASDESSERKVRVRYVPRGQGVASEAVLIVEDKIARELPKRVTVLHHPRRHGVVAIFEALPWSTADV